MSRCAGEPAEQMAEQYIAGTLPDPEAQAFEEHYFDCPVCLAQLQALQAVAGQMRRNPVKIPGRVIRWPAVAGTIGAIAALLLMTVIGYREMVHRPGVAAGPGKTATPSMEKTASSAAVTQIADLTLPPFAASSLRGEAEDTHYAAGMKAYTSGDCAAAANQLAQVSARSGDALSARFYSGVCQLKLNQLDAASTTLGRVAGKGDSPEQEAALYYLAQIALLHDDSAGAREQLEKVISLHGDFEQRAASELRRLSAK